MIYSQFGTEVQLLAYCGKHKKRDQPAPMMLVKVRYMDADRQERHQFVHTLRADGGINEIEAAVDALYETVLTGEMLKAALKEAE